MKANVISLICLCSIISLSGCGGRKDADRQKAEEIQDSVSQRESLELITARTLGLAYLEENKLKEAEEQFLKLIELAPEEALGYANLGIVYMRTDRLREAEEQLNKAKELDPGNPDIRLNLVKVYELTNQSQKAISELEKTVEDTPDHVKTLYSLAESYQQSPDRYSLFQWEKYLQRIVDVTPTNIASRLHLIEALLRNKNSDQALRHLEEFSSLLPDFPLGSEESYESAISFLHTSNIDEAFFAVTIFHNYLKLTQSYQADIRELKGPAGSSIGFPVITFSEPTLSFLGEGQSLLEAIRFTDVTKSAGLEISTYTFSDLKKNLSLTTHLAVADIDRDGDQDIYVGSYDRKASKFSHYLFENDLGRFKEISQEAEIRHSGKEASAVFSDYDNDGYLDLYVLKEGANLLYRNVEEGKFQVVTEKAILGNARDGYLAKFFDMDHEGDLDLFVSGQNSNQLYRNNGDATFLEQPGALQITSRHVRSLDAGSGDFDNDGDIDLFVINEGASNALYTNLRQGRFEDVALQSGLESDGKSGAVTVGDYDNDGFLDLFVTAREGGDHRLWRNKGDGTFERDNQSTGLTDALRNVKGYDASFFDLDNDGFLDLLVVGESIQQGGKGVFLFHNDGSGKFEDVSHLLPEDLLSGRQIVIADYNEDGDLDIFLAGLYGGIRLLRNDGGNSNYHLKIQLVGLSTGSGKVNHFGIGSTLEVRAGDLYQMKVVERPEVHFGLGHRPRADVVRILWTNGTPQNIFSPGSDQDLVEQQQLKGSCPFVYTWNGKEFVFAKDMLWQSAIGMPLGIMGGATAYAFPDPSEEYIKIQGDILKPKDGRYLLQFTSELWETIYFDQMQLIVLDHPDSIDIFVDERFTPPPFPAYQVYSVAEKQIPNSAMDGNGQDLLSFISKKDDNYISNFRRGKYQGVTEMKDLILDLGEVTQTDNLFLFLNGWVFPTDASINVAISQSNEIQVISPHLQVINEDGHWQTVIPNLGFPMGKDKTVIADLSGKFVTGDHRVRIRTNMEIYWDYIFFSNSSEGSPIHSTWLKPFSADLHYRGFSQLYRKGGRYGPHWFDYYDVSTVKKWRDLLGDYTRYGDVRELLVEADDKYIVSNAGDETSIEFDAANIPELPSGWTRDFIIHGVGWVKDGDLNTASGQTVEPLPFHGMTSYPYGEEENYPTDKDHAKYRNEYNTRTVTSRDFQRVVIEYR